MNERTSGQAPSAYPLEICRQCVRPIAGPGVDGLCVPCAELKASREQR